MKAVLIPAQGKNGAVKLCLVLTLAEEVKGQLRRTCLVQSCIDLLIQQNLPSGDRAGRREQANGNRALAAIPVDVLHQKLVGEDAGQVEWPRGFDVLLGVVRFEGHLDEATFSQLGSAVQLNVLRLHNLEVMPHAIQHLVYSVLPNLVVLQVADLQVEGRGLADGAGVEVIISGHTDLKGVRAVVVVGPLNSKVESGPLDTQYWAPPLAGRPIPGALLSCLL